MRHFKDITAPFKPAIFIDGKVSKGVRSVARYFCLFVALSAFFASFLDLGSESYNTFPDGIFFLFLVLFIALFLLEAFYNSSRLSEASIDFVAAQIIANAEEGDITKSFLVSEEGASLSARLGFGKEQINSFLESDREHIYGNAAELRSTDEKGAINFADIAEGVYASDQSFAQFLSQCEVSAEIFLQAARWINERADKTAKAERWWSREYLDTIASIGSSLSFGTVPHLDRYTTHITGNADLSGGYRMKEVSQVENALARMREANVVVVDDDESVSRDILERLAKKIKLGKTVPLLEHKAVLLLDWPVMLADNNVKTKLEREIATILSECLHAGNIILYIPNFPTLVADAKKTGVNIPVLMEEYLALPKINIIAHASKTDFYYFIETNPGLARVFERVIPEEKGAKSIMPILLEKIIQIERAFHGEIFFTYQAAVEIAELGERMIPYGEIPTKALDLLDEIAPWALKGGLATILKNDVDAFMSAKTGVPAGEISGDEAAKLTKLEELLHQRIVGQDEAVNAISSALRRARAGVSSPRKPIASFLFLGPTGVGKTETARTLAESFFGSEDRMNRFDMSEFSGPDALPRLIGSFSEGRSGVLANKLRDRPYSLVLLDEFEKAAPDVHNLFLRILDEGKFTDALGNEVSARNSIIIATSNAGSDVVWNIVRSGGNLSEKKEQIIDSLIDNHIFRPELLNRFDGIVAFKPLNDAELRRVAEKSLESLVGRLEREKQVKISASPELLDYLVLHGKTKEFGARSINRIIQDKVEDTLSKKIISGLARPGSTVEIGIRDVM